MKRMFSLLVDVEGAMGASKQAMGPRGCQLRFLARWFGVAAASGQDGG